MLRHPKDKTDIKQERHSMSKIAGYDQEMIDAIVKVQDKFEKRINVLDYALMNEDGHTYFLQKILQHTRKGKQVFIESFLNRMLEEDYVDEEYKVSSQVQISVGDEKRRLDLLIESPGKYIIIENKVKLATDGDRQMEAYWKFANKQAGDRARLVYLTLAGGAPAKWSLSDRNRDELLEASACRYCEKNYRTDIVEWLKEDVLPNCLVSESYLSQSIRLYIDSISRLSGIYDKSDMAEKIYDILKGYGVSGFDGVQGIYQRLNVELGKMKTCDENWVLVKETVDLVGIVRAWLVRKCVYDSPWDTAYNLKWLLRNNPTLAYKMFGEFKVAPFTSIGQFAYLGNNYVQLATQKYNEIGSNLRIHICCSEDGIKKGPYVFAEIEKFISPETMKDGGFEKERDCYRWPMLDFDKTRTQLADVARHVEAMIEKLCLLAKQSGTLLTIGA